MSLDGLYTWILGITFLIYAFLSSVKQDIKNNAYKPQCFLSEIKHI